MALEIPLDIADLCKETNSFRGDDGKYPLRLIADDGQLKWTSYVGDSSNLERYQRGVRVLKRWLDNGRDILQTIGWIDDGNGPVCCDMLRDPEQGGLGGVARRDAAELSSRLLEAEDVADYLDCQEFLDATAKVNLWSLRVVDQIDPPLDILVLQGGTPAREEMLPAGLGNANVLNALQGDALPLVRTMTSRTYRRLVHAIANRQVVYQHDRAARNTLKWAGFAPGMLDKRDQAVTGQDLCDLPFATVALSRAILNDTGDRVVHITVVAEAQSQKGPHQLTDAQGAYDNNSRCYADLAICAVEAGPHAEPVLVDLLRSEPIYEADNIPREYVHHEGLSTSTVAALNKWLETGQLAGKEVANVEIQVRIRARLGWEHTVHRGELLVLLQHQDNHGLAYNTERDPQRYGHYVRQHSGNMPAVQE